MKTSKKDYIKMVVSLRQVREFMPDHTYKRLVYLMTDFFASQLNFKSEVFISCCHIKEVEIFK